MGYYHRKYSAAFLTFTEVGKPQALASVVCWIKTCGWGAEGPVGSDGRSPLLLGVFYFGFSLTGGDIAIT